MRRMNCLRSPLILAVLVAAVGPAPARADEDDDPLVAPIHIDDAKLPSPRRTPGEMVAKPNLKELCAAGPAKPAPLPAAGPCDEAFAAYRIPPEQRFQYVCRYLVPPGIGGALTAANVWPQIAEEAALKERLDRDIARRVCNEEVPLATAEREVAGDWIAAYRKYLIPDDPAPIIRTAHEPVVHMRRKPKDDVATVDDPAADAAIAGAAASGAGGGYGAGYAPQSALPQTSSGGYGGGGNGGVSGGSGGGGGLGANGSNTPNRQAARQNQDGLGRPQTIPGSYAPLIDRSPRQGATTGARGTAITPRTQVPARQAVTGGPPRRFAAGRAGARRR